MSVSDGESTLAAPSAASEEVSADARQFFQARRIATGTRVGRYVVEREVGHGGMGVVYQADDPELGRKVALKWLLALQPEASEGPSANRLQAEAQALGRLNHPNVVSAHDFGTHGGRVWLAMEFVDGMTLRRWLKRQPRSWREVMPVLEAVARGVAAAHAAGLVHRDLKPDNVMIGHDGRIKVMDFGLARAERSRGDGPVVLATMSTEQGLLAEADPEIRMTRTGTAIGTPAYWAPEVWDGHDAGPAADQFSWCVMAWEALFSRHPYADESRESLAAAVRAGRRLLPPSGAQVPGWLRRVLLRGLAVAPRRRYPDMTRLLAALDAGRRRHRVLVVLGVAVPAFASLLLVQQWLRVRAIAACDEQAHEAVAVVWNEAARSSLRDGLLRTGAPFAAVTADKLLPWLDAYAAAWTDAAVAVCRRADVEDGWKPELVVAARECLAERGQYLETLLGTLAAAEDDTEGRGAASAAGTAVASLPGIDACLDERRLGARPLALDGQRQEVRRIRGIVARAAALDAAGQYREGLAQIEIAGRDAEVLGWPPLRAEVARRRGSLQVALGEYEAAEETLKAGYLLAGEVGEDELFADTASALAFTVGYHLARHAEGIHWGLTAEMLLKRFWTPRDNIRWAQVLDNLGSAYQEDGQFERAIELYQRAIGIAEAALGPDHPALVRYVRNLAWGYYAMGAYDQTDTHITRALALAESTLGPEHPEVAGLLTIVGDVHHARGKDDAAIAVHRRVLAMLVDAYGDLHPTVAMAHSNIGIAHESRGETAETIHHFERALEVRKAVFGADHPRVARSISNLGSAYYGNGEYDRAIALNEEALAMLERRLAPMHPDLLAPLNILAQAYQARGDLPRARTTFERALAVARASLGPEHPNVAALLGNLSSVLYEQGHESEAIAHIQQSLTLKEKSLGADNPQLLSTLSFLGYLHARGACRGGPAGPRAGARAGRARRQRAVHTRRDALLAGDGAVGRAGGARPGTGAGRDGARRVRQRRRAGRGGEGRGRGLAGDAQGRVGARAAVM